MAVDLSKANNLTFGHIIGTNVNIDNIDTTCLIPYYGKDSTGIGFFGNVTSDNKTDFIDSNNKALVTSGYLRNYISSIGGTKGVKILNAPCLYGDIYNAFNDGYLPAINVFSRYIIVLDVGKSGSMINGSYIGVNTVNISGGSYTGMHPYAIIGTLKGSETDTFTDLTVSDKEYYYRINFDYDYNDASAQVMFRVQNLDAVRLRGIADPSSSDDAVNLGYLQEYVYDAMTLTNETTIGQMFNPLVNNRGKNSIFMEYKVNMTDGDDTLEGTFRVLWWQGYGSIVEPYQATGIFAPSSGDFEIWKFYPYGYTQGQELVVDCLERHRINSTEIVV